MCPGAIFFFFFFLYFAVIVCYSKLYIYITYLFFSSIYIPACSFALTTNIYRVTIIITTVMCHVYKLI